MASSVSTIGAATGTQRAYRYLRTPGSHCLGASPDAPSFATSVESTTRFRPAVQRPGLCRAARLVPGDRIIDSVYFGDVKWMRFVRLWLSAGLVVFAGVKVLDVAQGDDLTSDLTSEGAVAAAISLAFAVVAAVVTWSERRSTRP